MTDLVRIAFDSHINFHFAPYANICSYLNYSTKPALVNMGIIGYTFPMKRLLIVLMVLMLLFGCACNPTASDETDKLEIYAFSVGKADALLVRTQSAAIMIDTGENGDGEDLVKRLNELGVKRLDLLILTHFDKDHIGGADTIITSLPIDRIVLPSYEKESKQYTQLLGALTQTEAEVSYLTKDLSLDYGEMSLDVWVSPVPFDGESDNEQSLITRVLYQGKTLLFMGDAEGAELEKLVFGTRNLTCDVLKLPHHGVYDENTFVLMTASMPSYVIICDSAKNPAASETLQAMALYDPVILQTKDGEVYLTVAGGVIRVGE